MLWPEPVLQKRPSVKPSDNIAYQALSWLDSLLMKQDEESGLTSHIINLDDDALDMFDKWRTEHAENQPEGDMVGMWGKMTGLCLRFALMFEFLWASVGLKQ